MSDGAPEIFISRTKKILELRKGEKIVRSFPVTPGSDDQSAPPGDWEIDVIA